LAGIIKSELYDTVGIFVPTSDIRCIYRNIGEAFANLMWWMILSHNGTFRGSSKELKF